MTSSYSKPPFSLVHRKQQRRRRLRKRHLKSEGALLQTLSRVFFLIQFVKSWQFFLELNSKRLYRSSEKEEESRCHTSPCVHVLHKTWNSAFSRRGCSVTAKKCTKNVMHVQSCCFANLNLLLFRWCYTRRFATTILSATQRCNIVSNSYNTVPTLQRRVALKIVVAYRLV